MDENPLDLIDPSIVNEDELMLTAERLFEEAGQSVQKKASALEELCIQMLDLPTVRIDFYKNIMSRKFKVPKTVFADMLKTLRQQRDADMGLDVDEEEGLSVPLITRVESFINRRYVIRYNVISNQFQSRKNDNESPYELMNENNILRDLKQHHFNYPMTNLIELLKSDFVPRYNPIKEYFEQLEPWDGRTDYIGELSKYINLEDESERDRFKRMFAKMFVRSIACSFEEAFNKHAFILIHEAQSSGKTTFLRWLCPKKLKDYFSEELSLDKDGMISLTENFIINMDELSTMSKYEINSLKSVLSKDKVKVRIPYERRPTILQRRCNFVGSTNRREFLTDETGNVRWICFVIKSINWSYMADIDIDMVWAQAYHLKNNTKFQYQLTAEELEENEKANANFLTRTPEMELIQKCYSPSSQGVLGAQFKTATDILQFIQTKVNMRLTAVNIGKALSILGFAREHLWQGELGYTVKGYWVYEKSDLEQANETAKLTICTNSQDDCETKPPF
ncbi:MAG TPA: hypothetical protein DEO70_12085 [Bacteroidales bacterium]|nr:MAG: hypothetical protein A2X11_10075 [Bacteroidetes bacterium GWE2_42_24]OFY25859.1 MAG: hypothetical protein A2X09_09450 [Bacteroidetes bacterium GWF2_43_11]HBZ67567.1 hypothetical protein [Bacteroidales bacterium]